MRPNSSRAPDNVGVLPMPIFPCKARWQAGAASLALAVLMSACAQSPVPPPSAPALSIEERVQQLEWRLDALERFATNLPSIPVRKRSEIEENVRALEQQRIKLLERYLPAHPSIREVDLSLRLLRWQLQMLDQAAPPP